MMLAESDFFDLAAKLSTSIIGVGILLLGAVAYYKTFVAKNSVAKKNGDDETVKALTSLTNEIKKMNNNGNGCPNTENIGQIKDVTLRDQTPLQMNLRNIKSEQRIKTIELSGIATAQHQLDMRRVAQEQSRMMNKDCSPEELKFANMKTGEFPSIDIKPVVD